MNLREWASNNSDFLSHIPEVDKVSETVMTVLGMQWCTPTDQISLAGHDVEHVIVRTKRQMLQVVSKFIDPMGLLSPILLQPKIRIQNLWKLKCDWDDILPTEILNKWKEVTGDLKQIHEIQIPRRMTVAHPGAVTYTLHCFCDASHTAYAACVYLAVVDEQSGCDSCHLVFSKTRQAPIKELTIPRLELMAASIGILSLRLILYSHN